MQNHEGTIIGIGAIAMGILGYACYHMILEKNKYKKNFTKLKATVSTPSKLTEADLIQLKNDPTKRLDIYIPAVYPVLNRSTFEIIERERPMYYSHNLDLSNDFLENRAGGRFTFKSERIENMEITVDIKDCHIDTSLLQTRSTPVKIFNLDTGYDPLYEKVQITISPHVMVGICGVIGYNITENKFILSPNFLCLANNTQHNILNYCDSKINFCYFKIFLVAIGIGFIGYYSIFKSVINLFKRYSEKFKQIKKDDLEFFKEKKVYYAKASSALVCELCKKNNINIAYQCGHLAVCEECHQASEDKKCPICSKVSKRFLKIFT